MKPIVVVVALLSVAACAQQLNVTEQPNTIYVGADGRYEANPDTAVVNFNISAQDSTSQRAYDRASQATQQVRGLLSANGIDPKLAEFGFFSLEPVQDWRDPKHKIVAYRVNSSVSVKLRDFNKIGPLVQKLGASDIAGDQSLNYILDNMQAAKIKASEDAFRNARAQAAALAQAAGRTLGELSYASLDVSQPAPIMMTARRAMTAEAAPAPTEAFTPQKITVTAHVNAVFQLTGRP
jgi:uncharacterized protein YggE